MDDEDDEDEAAARALDEAPATVQSQLQWAMEHRAWHRNVEANIVKPKRSPINVPLLLCQRSKAKAKTKHLAKKQQQQFSSLKRSALTQRQYADLLSTFTPHACSLKPKKKKPNCSRMMAPCPARLVQLAVPSKRLVFSTWRDHWNLLPPGAIVRFNLILQSSGNPGLEPSDARYHFKQMDKRQRQLRKKQKPSQKPKNVDSIGCQWYDLEADYLAGAVCQYIAQQPLFELNHNQMQLSNEMLRYFYAKNRRIPSRTTSRNLKHKTLVEIADKVAKCLDDMARFVDVQPLDRDELNMMVRPLASPSLEDLLVVVSEGGESETEDEIASRIDGEVAISEVDEDVKHEAAAGIFDTEDQIGKVTISEVIDDEDVQNEAAAAAGDGVDDGYRRRFFDSEDRTGIVAISKVIDEEMTNEANDDDDDGDNADGFEQIFGYEGDWIYSGYGFVKDTSIIDDFEDDLDRLIKILSGSDDEFLDAPVRADYLPQGTTYRELLTDLKALRDGLLDVSMDTRNPLELLMHDWAMRNEPDKVDAELEEQIRVTSALLRQYFRTTAVIPPPVVTPPPPPPPLPTITEVEEDENDAAEVETIDEADKGGPDVVVAVDEIIGAAQNAVQQLEEAEEEEEEEVDASIGKSAAASVVLGSIAPSAQAVVKHSHAKFELNGNGNEHYEVRSQGSVENEARTLAMLLRSMVRDNDEDSDSIETGGDEESPTTSRRSTPFDEKDAEQESLEDSASKAMINKSLDKISLVDDFPRPDTAEQASFDASFDASIEKSVDKMSLVDDFPRPDTAKQESLYDSTKAWMKKSADKISLVDDSARSDTVEQKNWDDSTEALMEKSADKMTLVGPPGTVKQESLDDLTKAMMKRSLDKISLPDDYSGPDTAGLDDLVKIIRGHKPSAVYDHAPDTICCLSLKIWAVWLLEISTNAHKWTKWITDIIRQVRRFASIIRGDNSPKEKQQLTKAEWKRFCGDTEEKILAWRQYSRHVEALSTEIMETFHGKQVLCCPKCLQDHMIKNVVTAHETLQALTEAVSCTSYWHRCLDKIVAQTADGDLLNKALKSKADETKQESLDDQTKAMMKRSLDKSSPLDDAFPGPDTAGLDDLVKIIRGHKPSTVYDHAPNTICCLSLKIWAVWLLEISTNAHKWTKWITDIIRQVRRYAAIIRGDVVMPDGTKKQLTKAEWRRFCGDTEQKIVAWRQYGSHVEALSKEITQTFHGKQVLCCPKCLQDHMIKNVVTAHETLQALTEAVSCTSYWHRCLDKVVAETGVDGDLLSEIPSVDALLSTGSSTGSVGVIEEMCSCKKKRVRFDVESSHSESSVYEIEEVE